MISKGFKKQMIDNAYKTQLLPITDEIHNSSVDDVKRINNYLLFRKDESLWVKYKFKGNIIDFDIHFFLDYLTDSIRAIYQYSEKKFNIQKRILIDIKNTVANKRDIDKSHDYAKYLEDIYD